MMSRLAYTGAGAILVLAIEAGLFFIPATHEYLFGPHTFAECATSYGLVPDTYPSQCKTPGGRIFSDSVQNGAVFAVFSDLSSPISSPLTLDAAAPAGEAVGVSLLNALGAEIGSTTLADGGASGQGLVHHTGVLTFAAQTSGSVGSATFFKEGGPMSIPVIFK